MNDCKKDVAQDITDRILAELEKGCVPWHRPWECTGGELPKSMSTGKYYQGVNTFLLGLTGMLEGYSSPWWGTYKQIQTLGGKVRKGQKGSHIVFYKTLTVDEKDENGDATGNEKHIPMLRGFVVFNAGQCDGLGDRYTTVVDGPKHEWVPIDECERVVNEYVNRGPMLIHGGNRACYSPSEDCVRMPEKTAFEVKEEYYSTIFHELTHSTGHAKRLNREGIVENHSFGDPLYSAEELVAEMGAAMICARIGIDQTATVPNSASYLEHWIKVLKGNKKLILGAAAKAQKAMDLVAPVAEETVGKELVTV